LKTRGQGLYNCRGQHSLPNTDSNPGVVVKPRRWTIFAAGLLLLALALVVIYTNRGAFLSPLALVVVAAIGLAALLLQLRLRHTPTAQVRSPLWLNVLGIAFAVAAVGADIVRPNSAWMLIAALCAVFCFAISGVIVLDGLRKNRA
jgi:hypothetical protein